MRMGQTDACNTTGLLEMNPHTDRSRILNITDIAGGTWCKCDVASMLPAQVQRSQLAAFNDCRSYAQTSSKSCN